MPNIVFRYSIPRRQSAIRSRSREQWEGMKLLHSYLLHALLCLCGLLPLSGCSTIENTKATASATPVSGPASVDSSPSSVHFEDVSESAGLHYRWTITAKR